ncbi:MAG: flagellar biosynthesis protein FliQ [Alphaproteobacteria bacterium]
MTETEILDVTREALLISIQIGAPILLIGLVVGVSIALVQALTQIQEITLVFVPKILAIFLAMFVFLPWMMTVLTDFMHSLADRMIGLG